MHLLNKNIIIYGGGNLVYGLVQIVAMPLIVKSMSLSDVASTNILLSSVVLLSSIITMGMDSASTHLMRKETEETAKIIFTNSFITIIMMAAVALPISMLLGLLFSNIQNSTNMTVLFCMWILSAAINQYNLNWIKYSFNQKAFLQVVLLQSSTFILGISILHYRNAISLESFLFVMMASSSIPSVLGLIVNRRMFIAKANTKIMKNGVRYGAPFMLTAFGFNFIFSSDRFFLLGNISTEDLAVYTQTFRIASIFSIAISSFNFAFAPYVLSTLDNINSDSELSRVRRNYIFVLTLISLIFIATSKILIKLLAGEVFLAGATLIPLFLFGYIAYGLFSFSQIGIIKAKNSRHLVIVLAIGLPVNIILNLLLISHFGYYGSAIAFVISIVTMNVVAQIQSNREYSFSFDSSDIILCIVPIVAGVLLSLFSVSQQLYIDSAIKSMIVLLLYFLLYRRFIEYKAQSGQKNDKENSYTSH